MNLLGRIVMRTKEALGLTGPENEAKWRRITGRDPLTNWAGVPMTAEGALQLSAAHSCIRLNSETVATLPLGVFERQSDGSKKQADHPLYGVLHDSPNADQTAVEYWEGLVASICLWGNGYSEKVLSGPRLTALQPLASPLTNPYRTRDGDLRYRFYDRGKKEDLPEDKVFHIRGFGFGGDLGLSPISYARQTLGIASATEQAAGRLFRQGMRASGVFTVPPGVTTDQIKQFRKNYVEPAEGVEGEGKSIVVPPGFGWQGMNIPPKDAETLLSRRYSVEEICRWFRTPPILIGHSQEGQTMWGSGIEQIMIGWLTLGLRAYLKRIESAIQKRLFTAVERGRFFAEFNVEGLLRADSASRATFLSTLAQNGFITRNEGRALDNRPPIAGGDVLTVQSNLMPLDQLGKQQASGEQARQALLNWIREGEAIGRPKLEVVK